MSKPSRMFSCSPKILLTTGFFLQAYRPHYILFYTQELKHVMEYLTFVLLNKKQIIRYFHIS